MFDIGFWELALLAVVALLVVGPERLPKVARTAGMWVGRGRRMLGSIKSEIDQEIKAQELKDILDRQAKSNPLESILEQEAKPSGSAAPPTKQADRSKPAEKTGSASA